MKVLQINSVCGIGSTGRIATDIHHLLKDQGHESYIAYGRELSQNCETAIRIGTKFNNYTHGALTKILDRHGFGSRKATIEFINFVETYDPDVIHLHNIHGYYINIELLFNYLKKTDKPIIWTLHDCWSFTGHCAYFDFVNCQKWKECCFKCPQMNMYPSSLLRDNSRNNYIDKKKLFTGIKNMKIITPSKWLANLVKESYLKEYPVEVINNGVNLDTFKPTDSNFRGITGLENNFMILGVANSWGERKGFKYFIELSKKLKSDEKIVLVGLTERQKENLPKNIIGITKTNNIEELATIYSAADVFVNPTLEDNFPTTNLEALACGTPVITFNTGGSIECIDEHTGFIATKGDIKDIYKYISIVKEKGKSMYFNKCVNRATELYCKNDRFKEYIHLYEEIRI